MVAVVCIRCLAIRSKYIGPAVGQHIEPNTTSYIQAASGLQDKPALLSTLQIFMTTVIQPL
eukprot:3383512-Amphidinium_carterae.1